MRPNRRARPTTPFSTRRRSEDDQGRLRSLRGHASGTEGRLLREEIRVRCGQTAGRDQRPRFQRGGDLKMIKEGYDHFEVTHQEPKVDFCEKKYVFDAAKPPGATNDPVFNAAAKCPAYVVPDDIAEAVRQKQQDDEAEYAKLVAKGTPVAKLNTGIDGGMNQVFASKVPGASTGLSEGGDGQNLSLAFSTMPGTIPGTVNPPRAPDD